MPTPASGNNVSKGPTWVDHLVRAEPKAPLMAPFMAYLLLMLLNEVFPTRWQPLSIVLHMAGAGWVVWVFRGHYPPWGRSHAGIAILAGTLAAALWVGGQHLLDGVFVRGHSLGETLSLRLELPFVSLKSVVPEDPHARFGDGALFWGYVVLKICRAITIVPIVEELFWRGFILRAFIRWDWFDKVPWGTFAWRAFLGSALLSTVQHPGNWGVSIICWIFYNALFYWTKSLRCLMLVHGITNLVLYIYVIETGDWRFW
jgi:CAAX prenyl protease-like protein